MFGKSIFHATPKPVISAQRTMATAATHAKNAENFMNLAGEGLAKIAAKKVNAYFKSEPNPYLENGSTKPIELCTLDGMGERLKAALFGSPTSLVFLQGAKYLGRVPEFTRATPWHRRWRQEPSSFASFSRSEWRTAAIA